PFMGAIIDSGEPANLRQTVPEFRDFHRRIWAGEVNLADNHMKAVYGRVHLERLLRNTRQARIKRSRENRLRSACIAISHGPGFAVVPAGGSWSKLRRSDEQTAIRGTQPPSC